MVRYTADMNIISFRYESGTYANASGGFHWVGLVQENTLSEDTGVMQTRYIGTQSRSVSQFVDGPLNFPGTVSFFPQDWKFLVFALGSNVDAGSPSPYTHTISEKNGSGLMNAFTSGPLNPWMSFTLIDYQEGAVAGLNFVRTAAGCVADSITVSSSQGEPYNVEVSYIAQNVAFSSGATTLPTENTTRPFIWSDTRVHIPSGTVFDTITELSWTINNNMDPKHYLNGSRQISVPAPSNRDYEVSLTLDGTSENTKTLYDQNFLGGSTFNMMLEINASTGSRDMFLIMSGCEITKMEAPSKLSGLDEQTITIVPKNCNIIINDTTQLYNPW